MAVVARLFIGPADQADHDQLQLAVGERLAEAGGPPAGLMTHISSPAGDGFDVTCVFRNAKDWAVYWDEIALPAIDAAGLTASEPDVTEVWGFARP